MKSISIDFKNHIMCIMTDGQQGTEYCPNIKKEDLQEFFPEKKYMEYASFTWNFNDECFAVNQEHKMFPGSIMTHEDFLPEIIIPYYGIRKKYKEFIKRIGIEECRTEDIFPAELRKFLGL